VPRAPRVIAPGGIYHVTSRGNRKESIFFSDADRTLFLEILRQVVTRHGWQLFAYCLMHNHYHLVVQVPQADLPTGMRTVNGDYAQWFNRVHGLVGHVFQARYHAVLVESDWHLLHLTRYLALNPVRAGLCESPTDWSWGSYAAIVSSQSSPLVSARRTLRYFGSNLKAARRAFREFVESPPDLDRPFVDMAGPGPVASPLAAS
jgi:putative transposase